MSLDETLMNFPCLWDPADIHYKNKAVKVQARQKVLDIFNTNNPDHPMTLKDMKKKLESFKKVMKKKKTRGPREFMWKSREGLRMNTNGTTTPLPIITKELIAEEKTILINGYSIALSLISIVKAHSIVSEAINHISPLHAHFYTNAFRWSLRHLNAVTDWLGDARGKYFETHKLWRQRYHFVNDFVPKYLRYLVPWVREEEWREEERDYQYFKRYAESTFTKQKVYPKTDKDLILNDVTHQVSSTSHVHNQWKHSKSSSESN